jgi:hypothetical protein
MSQLEECPSSEKQFLDEGRMVYVVRTYKPHAILSGFQTVGIYENPEVAVMVADDEYYNLNQEIGCLVEAFKLNHYYGTKRGKIIYRIERETRGTNKV